MDEDGEVDSKQLRRQVREDCNVSWIYDDLSYNVHVSESSYIFPWGGLPNEHSKS